MPVLQTFMCCFRLRTGGVVIGFVGLVWEVISLIGDYTFLANFDDDVLSEMGAMVNSPESISLALTVISVITDILLIWGAHEKKRFLLLPWLINTMMITVITFFTITIGIILANNGFDRESVAVLFIMVFLITGIILYVWLCVLSLFQEFREDSITLTPVKYNSPPFTALHESR